MDVLVTLIKFLIVFPVWIGTKICWPLLDKNGDIKKYDPTLAEWIKHGTGQALGVGLFFWAVLVLIIWIL